MPIYAEKPSIRPTSADSSVMATRSVNNMSSSGGNICVNICGVVVEKPASTTAISRKNTKPSLFDALSSFFPSIPRRESSSPSSRHST